jgi:hypothetical protein
MRKLRRSEELMKEDKAPDFKEDAQGTFWF